jgi:hypothetical protein
MLEENGLAALGKKLVGLNILTAEELVRHGAEEIGQSCGLKVGPKMKLGKAIECLKAAKPPAKEPLSAELLEVRGLCFLCVFSNVLIERFRFLQFLRENGLENLASKLEELRVPTIKALVRRGAEEIGTLCGLKVGPKMKLGKALKRLNAGVEAVIAAAPLAPEHLSAELQEAIYLHISVPIFPSDLIAFIPSVPTGERSCEHSGPFGRDACTDHSGAGAARLG